MKTLEPCIVLSCANTLALMRVTLGGFLGFDQSAGLSFRWVGLGSGSGLGVGVGLGGNTGIALVWNLMLPLTQSIVGLQLVSQQCPSMRVQLESKGVT